jgi:hypothetical protein
MPSKCEALSSNPRTQKKRKKEKHPKNKKKGFLWLTVSEVAGCGFLAPCFGPVLRQHIMVGPHGRGNCSPHGSQEAKDRQEVAEIPLSLSRLSSQ